MKASDIKVGDEFYMKGDYANPECKCTVVEKTNLFVVLRKDTGEEMTLEPYFVAFPKFRPFAEWKAERERQIAEAYARYSA